MDTKTAIAIVTNRAIKPQTVEALGKLLIHTDKAVDLIVATRGYTIAENRSYAVRRASEKGCTHILFIDDDMTFPKDTLDKLLAHGKEIIGVNSQSRTLPLSTTVALLKDGEHWPHDHVPPYWKMPDTLFEVFSIGMGVALIDLAVFDRIDEPWFAFEVHPSGKVLVGEDAWFCREARSKGYQIWCDPDLPIGHIGDYNYSAWEVKDEI